MKTSIRERQGKMRLHAHSTRAIGGALLLLTTLALVAALSGSSSSAQGQSFTPTSKRGSHAAAPMAGERIAFSGRRNGGYPNIYAMDPDGSNVTRLTIPPSGSFDANPKWSPNGSMIAFVRYSPPNGYSLYVVNADGSNPHAITSGAYGVKDEAWSPDGSRIAFSGHPAPQGGPYEIYVMNADGSGITQITNDQTLCVDPDWSPDGSKIAYVKEDMNLGQNNVYIMNANGSNSLRITSGGYASEPAWSPDGQTIAYSRAGNGVLPHIWTVHPDGNGLTQITTGQDDYPTWSLDGRHIAFKRATNTTHIVVSNADGSNEHDISGNGTNDDMPDWGGSLTPVVLVQNEQGTPIPGAQVYTNTQGAGYPATLLGSTDMSGTISLPNPVQNEFLIARSLVYTGTTSKGSHDGWAYHVYLTDINQRSDGTQDAYAITDTSKLTQTVTIIPTNPLIGFNMVASVEYNATPTNLSQIVTGFAGTNTPQGFRLNPGANDYLLDVTDGQMFLEKMTVYEDKQHWADADYQFFAYYPRADANANALTGTSGQIHAQGSGHYGAPWNQIDAFSTLIHEFGHYAIGASDEYYYRYDGDTSQCPLVPDPDYERRDSIMDDQSTTSEFCTQDDHNPQTHQEVMNGESVWQTLKRNWSDNSGQNMWVIQSPIDRGYIDPGPDKFIAHQADETQSSIVSAAAPACAPIRVTTTWYGQPIRDASVSLTHHGYSINEGVTDTNGQALIYGAEIANDTVEASWHFADGLYTGSATISSCNALTVTLTLGPSSPASSADAGEPSGPSRPNTQWPTHWLTATADFSQHQVHAVLHFAADPPAQPTLYASQGGTNRQPVTLTYDPAGHNYTGDCPLDPNLALDFQFELGLSGPQGVELFPYTFDAAQFHANGPDRGAPAVPHAAAGKLPPMSPTPTPPIWDLFPAENMVSLSVSSTSLISGTGVMVGQVNSPAASPNELLAAGGPYFIQGENPISGSVYVSFEYQSEYFCGLQAGSVSIYRYNGTGWDALPTQLNEEWHLAAASITQWGIYAVFAQPNTQVVFSDVPAGSTFYDYINWMTCHSMASGYQDATFRPNNNATRGQISKMVANAYRWHLDPPSTGGYTFADVPPGSTFFLYVEAAYREGVAAGYPCGGVGEPCDPQHRPYFRPNNNVTRGQLAKIISNGSKWDDTPTGQTFEDVPPGSTFYAYIERMAGRGTINGYVCGGPGEPCNPSNNRPYFRPGNNATRGQLSKMIYLALQPR